MKNFNVHAFTKRAKTALVIVRSAYWLFLVFSCLTTIAIVLTSVLPDSMFDLKQLNLEHMRLELASGLSIDASGLVMNPTFNLKDLLIPILIGTLFTCLCLVKIFYELRGMLKQVIVGNPFASDNGNRLATIGGLLIGFSFLKPALVLLVYVRVLDIFELNAFTTNYKIDLFMLFIGLMVLLLSQIFNYGAFLQTEFDETL